ncbi:MAG: FMN-binding protein [Opitutaceae bacterium]
MTESTSEPISAPELPSSRSLIVTLGVIAMLSGLFIVLAYQLTKPQIALNRQRAMEKAIFAVIPEATSRTNLKVDASGLKVLPDDAFAEANVFAAYNAKGELAGLAMEASARGYQDVVTVLYGYSLDSQSIIGMTVLDSRETPGLGDRVESDPGFIANFENLDARLTDDGSAIANPIVTVKNGKKTQAWQIDGISGATVTSTAIGNGLRESTGRLLPLVVKFQASIDRVRTDLPANTEGGNP